MSYWALTEHFSLVVKSSLSRLSRSRFLSRMRLADRRPPKSSSLPGDTRPFSQGNNRMSHPFNLNRLSTEHTVHIFILLGKYDSKYILLYLPAFCHLTNNATALSLMLPPSIFSSLLISMTTNFSHTANVGRVEEMNWPNLSGEGRKLKFSFLFLLSVPLSLQ